MPNCAAAAQISYQLHAPICLHSAELFPLLNPFSVLSCPALLHEHVMQLSSLSFNACDSLCCFDMTLLNDSLHSVLMTALKLSFPPTGHDLLMLCDPTFMPHDCLSLVTARA